MNPAIHIYVCTNILYVSMQYTTLTIFLAIIIWILIIIILYSILENYVQLRIYCVHFSAHMSSKLLAMLGWLNLNVAPFVIQLYHLNQNYVLIIRSYMLWAWSEVHTACPCELCWGSLVALMCLFRTLRIPTQHPRSFTEVCLRWNTFEYTFICSISITSAYTS